MRGKKSLLTEGQRAAGKIASICCWSMPDKLTFHATQTLHTPTRVCTRRCAPSAEGWRRSDWAREAESLFSGEQETDGKTRQKHPTETDTQESPGKQLGYFRGSYLLPLPQCASRSLSLLFPHIHREVTLKKKKKKVKQKHWWDLL